MWGHWKDTVLFLGGLGGVIHETVVSGVDRPSLLVMFAAMMGLPAFLGADRRRNGGE